MVFYFWLLSLVFFSIITVDLFLLFFAQELVFISLMLYMWSHSMEQNNVEGCLKYMLVQGFASACLVLGLVMYSDFFSIFITLSLFIKLGMFPGTFWVSEITLKFSNFSLFLVSIWGKVVPIMFLSVIFHSYLVLLVSSIVSSVVSSFEAWGATNIKNFLGASSINHSVWMSLTAIEMQVSLAFLYLISYGAHLYLFLMNSYGMGSYIQLWAMSGMPPFLLFFSKLMILYFSLSLGCVYMFLVPMISSVFSLVPGLWWMMGYSWKVHSNFDILCTSGFSFILFCGAWGVFFHMLSSESFS